MVGISTGARSILRRDTLAILSYLALLIKCSLIRYI